MNGNNRIKFADLLLILLFVSTIIYFSLNFFGKNKSPDQKRGIWQLWGKVLIASVPAALVGIGLDKLLEALTSKDMDGWLYNAPVVAVMLIVYGVAFIAVERYHAKKNVLPAVQTVEQITYRKALGIGAFQALSIIPGTSRSGSTILGGMLSGVSRAAASEFSFFMAIPVMLGASGLKTVKFFLDGGSLTGFEWLLLALGVIFSFVISLLAIKFLMSFVKRHSFAPFGIYRIILGIAVLVYFIVGMLNA